MKGKGKGKGIWKPDWEDKMSMGKSDTNDDEDNKSDKSDGWGVYGMKWIGSVDREKGKQINAVNNNGTWEVIEVQIDSGAVDTVGPREIGSGFQLKETKSSRENENFVAANGTTIKNHGEKVIKGFTDGGIKMIVS